MKPNNARLTEGSISKHLMMMSFPTMLGIAAIMLFNVVDAFWLSRLGTKELSAISFTFPIVFIILGVSVGLSAGTTSVIAHTIGQGDDRAMRSQTLHALLLAFFVTAVTSAIGLLTMDSLFTLLGAGPDMLPLIKAFMWIWYLGLVLLVIPMSANAALRATGDSLTPGLIMLASAAVNAVLDPILIFGLFGFPRMEMAGAAVATVCSWLIAFLLVIYRLVRTEKMLTIEIPKLRTMLASWGTFLRIGLPAGATQTLSPLANGCLTALVATYGTAEVAGFGVGCRIEPIVIVPIIALSMTINPFVAQNWGAGRRDRVDHALKLVMRFAWIFGAILWPILALSARPFADFFTDDPRAAQTLVWFLWLMPISYGAEGVVLLTCAAFNGFHRPFLSAQLNIIRLLILYVPIAYIASYFLGVAGVFVGGAIANMASGFLAIRWLRITSDEIGYVELAAPDDPEF